MTESLLCVANFSSSTGYAWDFINELYAAMGSEAARRGMKAFVAYPELDGVPPALKESPLVPIRLTVGRNVATLRFLWANRVRVVYLSDRPTWSPLYGLFRWVGVERVVVHDHTSGARTIPAGAVRTLKQVRQLIPGTTADVGIAVSDYVARRMRDVDQLEPRRIHRVYNAVRAPTMGRPRTEARIRLEALAGTSGRPIVVCACRAAEYKGVPNLLRAFDRLLDQWVTGAKPLLVYFGDGPALEGWRKIHEGLRHGSEVVLAGSRPDARDLIAGADLAVVPSVWEEAFGLAALEPMARGVPVIASDVGGLAEVVEDERTGLRVAPGDETALTKAMERLLHDPAERARMGLLGAERARQLFDWEANVAQLANLVLGRPRARAVAASKRLRP